MIKEKKKDGIDKMEEIGDKIHKATIAKIRKINNKTVRRECLGLIGLFGFAGVISIMFAAVAAFAIGMTYAGIFIVHHLYLLVVFIPAIAYLIGIKIDGGKEDGNTKNIKVRRNSPKPKHSGSKGNKVGKQKTSRKKTTGNNR